MLHTTPMSTQEIFNIARDHLLKQNLKSVEEQRFGSQCLYRGPNGLMCAVGPFLTDEEAQDMETFDVLSAAEHELLPERLDPHLHLLASLQNIHDGSEPHLWEEDLKALAEKFNLEA